MFVVETIAGDYICCFDPNPALSVLTNTTGKRDRPETGMVTAASGINSEALHCEYGLDQELYFWQKPMCGM